MPLITLNIPQHKMPIVKEFIQEIGLKEKDVYTDPNSTFSRSQSAFRQNLSNTYYSPSRGWEFFINELEYE